MSLLIIIQRIYFQRWLQYREFPNKEIENENLRIGRRRDSDSRVVKYILDPGTSGCPVPMEGEISMTPSPLMGFRPWTCEWVYITEMEIDFICRQFYYREVVLWFVFSPLSSNVWLKCTHAAFFVGSRWYYSFHVAEIKAQTDLLEEGKTNKLHSPLLAVGGGTTRILLGLRTLWKGSVLVFMNTGK